MRWQLSNRSDPVAAAIADRHYNRQKVGSPQFVPPGKCVVLTIGNPATAFWVSSAPLAAYVKHQWAGAWVCTAFRNEGAGLSSDLIREAVAATTFLWGPPPELGILTFVDTDEVRKKRDPGRCYRKAGFYYVGQSKGGLVALMLDPADFPEPQAPRAPRHGLKTKLDAKLQETLTVGTEPRCIKEPKA